jgi:hypothetical protein
MRRGKMDKLQWFKFFYADWKMGKIQRCPEVTQARFMNLCCLYWSKEGNLSVEDAEIEIDKEHLDLLVSKKVVSINDDSVLIKFLDEQLEDITETSKGKSKAAKARWDKYREQNNSSKNNADAMHVHTDAMQMSAEKRREEERRGEKIIIDWDILLGMINKVGKREFKVIKDSVKKKYKALLKDGYTKEQIANAILNAHKDDYHIETNFKYLTPEYFSRAKTVDLHGLKEIKTVKEVRGGLYD